MISTDTETLLLVIYRESLLEIIKWQRIFLLTTKRATYPSWNANNTMMDDSHYLVTAKKNTKNAKPNESVAAKPR